MKQFKHKPILLGLWLSLGSILCPLSIANPKETLDAFVRQVLEHSPITKAADRAIAAQSLLTKSIGKPINPVVEFAPGIGFTNGNFALSQDFDIFGARSAEQQVQNARLMREVRESFLAKANLAYDAIEALYRWQSATESLELTNEVVANSLGLLTSTKKRFQLGEVPEVYVTRAEIGSIQAENLQAVAQLTVQTHRAALSGYLGAKLEERTLLGLGSGPMNLASPTAAESAESLLAESEVAAAEAELVLVKRQAKGSFVAGIAADFWSADRWQSQSTRQLGLQLSYRTTLADLGANRYMFKAAEERAAAKKQQLQGLQELAKLRFEQANVRYQKISELAERSRKDLLPKGSQMLEAMLKGYDSGIVTLTEVLEAQRALYELKKTDIETRLQQRLAEIDLLRSTLTVPGLEISR